ncbi:MAG: hypothetical protein K2K97_10690, partial [Muribaculaceae bacterium]|nr:hypothetical protein [Muribaculaceae bacterium]
LAENENRFLELIRTSSGGITVDEYMRVAHVSRSCAEETVANLYAMDVVDFAHDGTRFRIVAATH